MTLGGFLAGAHKTFYFIGRHCPRIPQKWLPKKRFRYHTGGVVEYDPAERDFLLRQYFSEHAHTARMVTPDEVRILIRADTSHFSRKLAPFLPPRRRVIPYAAWNLEGQEAAVRNLYESRL